MAEKKTFPEHVAVIMDGNGRWAKAHNQPRLFGHNAGMQAMKRIVIAAQESGVRYLTVYAFSTENWKRSTEEVQGIFRLIVKYVESELRELKENNVHINILGDYSMLPEASVRSLETLIGETKVNDGLKFNICLNYGGRDEIARAVNELTVKRMEQGLTPAECPVTEEEIARYLYTGSEHFDIPDPDLIIRTSGEERMSNFLTWQAAYSELMFTDTLWPDFGPEEFKQMLSDFGKRDRRFGGRKEEGK